MNSIVGPIFNENFVEKKVSRSHEQYIGSIGKHCSPLILLVKEVVGPVHNARDPLTDNILALLKKKKKKKKKENKNANTTPKTRIQTHTKWFNK